MDHTYFQQCQRQLGISSHLDQQMSSSGEGCSCLLLGKETMLGKKVNLDKRMYYLTQLQFKFFNFASMYIPNI